jgi:eukaryotic-like serine/threonine-protein kinase
MTHCIREFADLPLSTVLEIDKLADDFEAAMVGGGTPLVDFYLERLHAPSDAVRAVVLQHLEAIAENRDGSDSSNSDRPSAWPSRDNEMVGEYRLVERLGAGGMGVVFKAIHSRLDCLVAIKFPRFATPFDPALTKRFIREAKLLGRLQHAHIVRALDAGESHYGPYLVTEFIDGETIDALVKRAGPLPLAAALEFTRQAALALAYSHSLGVVHRDVKPSNLLVDQQGMLRIVDFGLAKPIGGNDGIANDGESTASNAFLGTVAYAAPEQLQPHNDVDHRADVYSLGCVLYFLLTGRALHSGSLTERLTTDGRSARTALKEALPHASAGVVSLWRRMIAAVPSERISSIAEVEQSLARMLASPSALVPRPARSTRRLFIFGIIAVGFAAATIIGFSRDRSTRKPSPAPNPAIAPFSPRQGNEHQQAWAAHLNRPTTTTNSIGMPLVLIPAGEFQMGQEFAEPDPPTAKGDWRSKDFETVQNEHEPIHRVLLTKPYYFGATEVTYQQFAEFVAATGYVTDAERTAGWGREDKGWVRRPGYSWKSMGQRVSDPDQPVINVSWNDATALCAWLTKHDPLGKYRLPTEAEWEFACRAGSTTRYYFGDDPDELSEHAWVKSSSKGRYRRVAQKSANPFGLYDLYGNRQEWCLDNFAVDYYGRSPLENPYLENGGSMRAIRGGAHTDENWFCTSARRWGQAADNVGAAGIRVACEPAAM